MAECTHDCSSCNETCSERKPESLRRELHPGSRVKKVFGIVSGKGGVGKSMVTSQLAVLTARKGYKTAIMDADITGPSIPKAFGVSRAEVRCGEDCFYPVVTKSGIQVMSMNLLLDSDTSPVVWRGPVIAGAVTQFWTDVIWEDVEYMFVDMPPGTGDVPLTVYQSIPLNGIVIVTSPQELVSMVVEKAVHMARMMEVPIVGVIENMSYVECPDCGRKIHLFGEGKTEEAAEKNGLKVLGKMPISPELAHLCDTGRIEDFMGTWLLSAADALEKV